ncbi:YwiC-like family protein [Limnochorda pilosa]|uniref:Uncharacterized protein n=1 Tax=Limnochorda pilosa TaxID=1555112 RepID=A0A0K2SPX1_LIMPI|nr:YwiC-like family protein [Limnochorda pilosa]BAS29160.1 hypothetical protein LIP_3348 [Limnochorda pilosa]
MSAPEATRAARPGAAARTRRRPIPGEHGAWGAFLTGIALGAALAVQAGGPLWPALSAGAAAVVLFMLREALFQAYRPQRARDPARQAAERQEAARARRWVLGELLALLVIGGLLVGATRQVWLVAAGAAGLGFLAFFVLLRRSRQERSAWAEVVGFVGMSAAGPMGYLLSVSTAVQEGLAGSEGPVLLHLAEGGLQWGTVERALLVWLLLALYFVGPVFYVKMKVAQQRERPSTPMDRVRLGWGTLLYSAALAAVLALAGSAAGVGTWPFVGYVPSLVKNVVGVFRVKLPLNLRRIGFTEVGLSLLFALGIFLGLG